MSLFFLQTLCLKHYIPSLFRNASSSGLVILRRLVLSGHAAVVPIARVLRHILVSLLSVVKRSRHVTILLLGLRSTLLLWLRLLLVLSSSRLCVHIAWVTICSYWHLARTRGWSVGRWLVRRCGTWTGVRSSSSCSTKSCSGWMADTSRRIQLKRTESLLVNLQRKDWWALIILLVWSRTFLSSYSFLSTRGDSVLFP